MKAKKILALGLLSMTVMLTAGFDSSNSVPPPSYVPNYTMVEIPDPPVCHALKVTGSGYMYDPWLEDQESSYTVYSPDYTSIWNLGGKYCHYYDFSVKVEVKWYSNSAWTTIGYIDIDDVSHTVYPENNYLNRQIDYLFISKVEFNYGEIVVPDGED